MEEQAVAMNTGAELRRRRRRRGEEEEGRERRRDSSGPIIISSSAPSPLLAAADDSPAPPSLFYLSPAFHSVPLPLSTFCFFLFPCLFFLIVQLSARSFTLWVWM